VLFLEHKRLYREPYNRSPHPGEDFTIPFGRARVVKPGRSPTVIAYGALVQKALAAAAEVERRNPYATVEVIDLRTWGASPDGGASSAFTPLVRKKLDWFERTTFQAAKVRNVSRLVSQTPNPSISFTRWLTAFRTPPLLRNR
jgi:hypothetical protein